MLKPSYDELTSAGTAEKSLFYVTQGLSHGHIGGSYHYLQIGGSRSRGRKGEENRWDGKKKQSDRLTWRLGVSALNRATVSVLYIVRTVVVGFVSGT